MKILNYQIQQDKLLHFWGGSFLFLIFASIMSPYMAFGLVSIIGVAKEVIRDNLLKMGTPDIYDTIATILGGLISMLLVLQIIVRFK